MAPLPTFWGSLAKALSSASKLRNVRIHFDRRKCKGTRQCYDVCPVGCWRPDPTTRDMVFRGRGICIACGACVLQCPEGAIELK